MNYKRKQSHSWHLVPLDVTNNDSPVFNITSDVLKLGRRQQCRITSLYVSRDHCELFLTRQQKVCLKANSNTYYRRHNQQNTQKLLHGKTVLLEAGDVVYLVQEGEVFMYGYSVEVDYDTSSQLGYLNCNKCHRNKKRICDICSATESVQKSQFTAPKRKSKQSTLFEGLSFAFWTHEHTGILVQRIIECGGCVQSKLLPTTDFLICPNDFSQKDKLQKLVQNFPWVKVVKMSYSSDCIEAGKLLNINQYIVKSKESDRHIQNQTQMQLSIAMSENFTSIGTGQLQASSQSPPEPEYVIRSQATLLPPGCLQPMGHLMQADYCNEPYDEVSAKQTIEKLRMHWYKIKEKEHVAFKANCGLQNEDYHHNGICDHIACCLLHICVVQQLEEARNNYKQNEQQFQIRAIQKGIKTLQNLEFPLEENQIEKLRIAPYNLGYKTIDKIKEIVSTGYLIRNQQISNDPQQLSVKELTKIWGVGEATAIKWFQQGIIAILQQRKYRNQRIDSIPMQIVLNQLIMECILPDTIIVKLEQRDISPFASLQIFNLRLQFLKWLD